MNTEIHKKALEAEREKLVAELSEVGRINPDNPADWEATPDADMNNTDPDKNVRADAVEEYETRSAVESTLENRLTSVNNALARIEDGSYGVCGTCGEKIEEARLEANPAADTCIAHKDKD